MTLIKSISGIRGTIGGQPGNSFSPIDIVAYSAAFGHWLLEKTGNPKIVIGRDARISGQLVSQLVSSTLQFLGMEVIDLGLSTTPTVELAVTMEQAGGGIILTASHNPREWNALKLLNQQGEFINAREGEEVLAKASQGNIVFADVSKLGTIIQKEDYLQKHIEAILAYPLVDTAAIASRNFKVIVDGINSSGALFVPHLLHALGVSRVEVIHAEMNGRFAHNPEPLAENLTEIMSLVSRSGADLGIVVDPDVDRLCLVSEDGQLFGEEYTLVAVADYILNHKKGPTVSNLSSTKALKDISDRHGVSYHASAVGEVNVVQRMKEVGAVIGGEGNGGIIVPDFHYGRDALIGIALFLTHLAKSGKSAQDLRRQYPDYYMSKNKIELLEGTALTPIFQQIADKYRAYPQNTEDGLKIDFGQDWVHLRASNTEPIIRIYAESQSATTASHIAAQLMTDIREFNRSV